MLSAASRPYIQASVPVLREQGMAITREFYAQLFRAHPELRHLFNQGNQANGAQQIALAGAVLAYAANIDNAAALAPVIDRIAHKHASVGITPAHYPIVGRHLLSAIQSVLGAGATPELLSAWDEAYWLLAGELIAAEARLYERASVDAGEFRPLVVARIEHEAAEVRSFYLQTTEGSSPGPFQPGQYVSVAVELPDGLRQLRQYSLSDAPSRPYWRISVKPERGLEGAAPGRVSNYLHERVRVGDRLRVGAPFGNFRPLQEQTHRPLALLSAGVGITPLLSALNSLVEARSERPVLFAHAARESTQQLFARDLDRARDRLPSLRVISFYERPGGHASSDARPGRMQLDAALLDAFEAGDFYLCGPLPFMREQWRSLVALGVSPARIEREVFGPELFDAPG